MSRCGVPVIEQARLSGEVFPSNGTLGSAMIPIHIARRQGAHVVAKDTTIQKAIENFRVAVASSQVRTSAGSNG